MNYLAHLYLSGKSSSVIFGNFIGDFVKGKAHEKFKPEIQKGIILHRAIDHFTDQHEIARKNKLFVRDKYHKYSGIIIDIFYDHFLASNWDYYCTKSLKKFSNNIHKILVLNYLNFPKKIRHLIPFIIQSKRLESYATLDGIQKTLKIMSKSSSLPEETEYAIKQLDKHYEIFSADFEVFFKDLINFVLKEFEIILPIPDDSYPALVR